MIVVPNLDPIGLPAHPTIFVALLLLTQFLHLLFMNFVLGGSLIAAGLIVAALRGHTTAGAMAGIFYRMVPVTISMAITMGVAPLLFVQVLYGQYFYSATVLMGFAWFSFFVAVLVGFYLVYWLIFRALGPSGRAGLRGALGLAACACFLWVGWIMANAHELGLHPALWRTGGGGSRCFTPAASTLPRYLHDLVGATAVAGLWLAGVGWWRMRRRNAAGAADGVDSDLVRLGLKAAMLATGAQMVVGIVFLITLLVGSATRTTLVTLNPLVATWTLGVVLAPVLFMLLFYASFRPQEFRWYGLACATAAVLIVGMLMGREHVRLAHLAVADGGAFTLKQWAVYPQNASLAVFAVLLVAGLAVVGTMVKWLVQSPPKATEPVAYAPPVDDQVQPPGATGN